MLLSGHETKPGPSLARLPVPQNRVGRVDVQANGDVAVSVGDDEQLNSRGVHGGGILVDPMVQDRLSMAIQDERPPEPLRAAMMEATPVPPARFPSLELAERTQEGRA